MGGEWEVVISRGARRVAHIVASVTNNKRQTTKLYLDSDFTYTVMSVSIVSLEEFHEE